MQHIFFSVFPIFAIIFIGKIIKHKWITSEDFWRGQEKLSYFMLFPAVMFNYITQTSFSSGELTKLVLSLCLITIIVSIIVVYIQEKLLSEEPKLFTSMFQGSVRYNNYLFIGIGGTLYGAEGLEIVAVVAAYMIIFTNAVSILAFNSYIQKSKYESKIDALFDILKKFSVNPLILSSILGFAFNHSGIEMNLAIRKILTILSDSALAISLMCLGAEVKFKIESANLAPILRTCFIKLILMPIIAFIIFTLFNITGTPKAVGILYSSLPCAGTSFVLSRQLGGDPKSVTSIITLSIILGIFTIPLMLYICVR